MDLNGLEGRNIWEELGKGKLQSDNIVWKMCFEQGVFPYKTKLANKQNLEIESKESLLPSSQKIQKPFHLCKIEELNKEF